MKWILGFSTSFWISTVFPVFLLYLLFVKKTTGSYKTDTKHSRYLWFATVKLLCQIIKCLCLSMCLSFSISCSVFKPSFGLLYSCSSFSQLHTYSVAVAKTYLCSNCLGCLSYKVHVHLVYFFKFPPMLLSCLQLQCSPNTKINSGQFRAKWQVVMFLSGRVVMQNRYSN